MRKTSRLIAGGLFAAWVFSHAGNSSAQSAPSAEEQFAKLVKPFLEKHCYECHNSGFREGDLDLESYKTAASVVEGRKRWEDVIRKLQAGQMPPKSQPRPDAAEVKAVVAWAEDLLAKAAR